MDLLIKNGKLLRYLPSGRGETVRIPDSVTAIGDRAFADTGAAEVIIPETVTSIGMGAFDGCSELESALLPETVSYIGREAFRGCAVREMTVPQKTGRLSNGCFCMCRSLEKITLHDKLIFGTDVFYGCCSVTSVSVGEMTIRSSALRDDPGCFERLSRAVRYGTVPLGIHPALRAQAACCIYFQSGSRDAEKYIRLNAVEVFKALAADGRSDLLIKLAGESWIAGKDIDALIESAIAAGQHEVYIMLTNLRHREAPAAAASDRFSL